MRNPGLHLSLSLAAALAGGPAAAQTAMTVEGGLGGSYRAESWVPLRVTLTHAGAPVRAELRARFRLYGEGATECRLPPRDLAAGANEAHTLYIRAPETYTGHALIVDLLRDGRKLTSTEPPLRLAGPEAYLVAGVGRPEATAFLNALTTVQLRPRPGSPLARSGQMVNAPPVVGLLTPAALPDRWQALQGADLVVLAGVGERELSSEQAGALRDYLTAGGTLVVTGGLNWNRLATPFYRDLLPIRVSASAVAPGWRKGPRSAIPIATGAATPDARVLESAGRWPLVAERPYGLGRVVFTAFDCSTEPMASWRGLRDFWKDLLTGPRRASLIDAARPGSEARGWGPYEVLADAPYSVPQLDIPAFYMVALFLAGYILVLVPGNYFLLKRRDRREWAWLTTPLIVLAFSAGAYGIGYALKGGRTRAVQVGLLETRAGAQAGRLLAYTGLFSPRKAGYDVRPFWPRPGLPGALLDEPRGARPRTGLRVRWEDGMQTLEDVGIDMWAMRVIEGETIVPAGKGIRVEQGSGGARIVNDTPWLLEACQLTWGGTTRTVGDLRPGQGVVAPEAGGGPPATRSAFQDNGRAAGEVGRLRKAALAAVPPELGTQPTTPSLRGWVSEPLLPLEVDRRRPEGVAQTLVVAHLADAP